MQMVAFQAAGSGPSLPPTPIARTDTHPYPTPTPSPLDHNPRERHHGHGVKSSERNHLLLRRHRL